MPFLVDSVTAAITARGLTMERLLHPVVDAVRTPEGRLRSIQPLEPDRALAGQRESLIFIEMDRTAARNRAALAIENEQVLDEVRRAVEIGRASCGERVCPQGGVWVVAGALKKK